MSFTATEPVPSQAPTHDASGVVLATAMPLGRSKVPSLVPSLPKAGEHGPAICDASGALVFSRPVRSRKQQVQDQTRTVYGNRDYE